MAGRLVVVAESSRARIYSAPGAHGLLSEIEDLAHPEGRLRVRDLTTDAPGRALDRGGGGRHSMDPSLDAKQHEAAVFARRIAELIEHARLHHDVGEIILVAPPRFLGLLRQSLGESARCLVVREIGKNLVRHDARQLAKAIDEP